MTLVYASSEKQITILNAIDDLIRKFFDFFSFHGKQAGEIKIGYEVSQRQC